MNLIDKLGCLGLFHNYKYSGQAINRWTHKPEKDIFVCRKCGKIKDKKVKK